MSTSRAFFLALMAAACAAPFARAENAGRSSVAVESPRVERREALRELRRRFLEPEVRSENSKSPESPSSLDTPAELEPLEAQAEFVRAGRVEAFDDWATYADMVVSVAGRLGVAPPESALALYRDRVRPAGAALTADESRARSTLLGIIGEPDFAKRYLYIPGLVDSAQPEIAAVPAPPPPAKRGKGKKSKRVRVARQPELAPPPKQVSVVDKIDWDKTDELADVADGNARNWDRRAGESAKRYARRLKRLRKHCYEWVRRDIAALGLWDDRLFRGEVAGTRRDPKRPIRAASFALAMAKIVAADPLAARTILRELNLRVDPIVRGSIIVFSQSVCGYDARNGHIEIVTSVVPLRAASYKFHDVKSDCLVRASALNRIHVYVPLKREPPPAVPAVKS
jgi:hypothetical protein